MSITQFNKLFICGRSLGLITAALIATATATATPGAARAEGPVTPQTVLEFLGIMKLRQMCYDRCAADLDKAAKKCDKKYPLLSPEWNECMGEALMVYYNCAEGCPPKEIVIEFPFGQ